MSLLPLQPQPLSDLVLVVKEIDLSRSENGTHGIDQEEGSRDMVPIHRE